MHRAVKSDNMRSCCKSIHKTFVSNEEVKSRAMSRSFLADKSQISRDSSRTDTSTKVQAQQSKAEVRQKRSSSKTSTTSKTSTSVQKKSEKSSTPKKSPVAIQKVEVVEKVRKVSSSISKIPHKPSLDNSKKSKVKPKVEVVKKDIVINITQENTSKIIAVTKPKEETPLLISELINNYNKNTLQNVNEVNSSIMLINSSTQDEEHKTKLQENENNLLNTETQ
jgi:hypothetical protein